MLLIGKTENQDFIQSKLLQKKSFAAGISLDASTIWITGGKNRGGNFALNSTEFVQKNQNSDHNIINFMYRPNILSFCFKFFIVA